MFEGEDIVKYGDLLETDADVYCFGHWHMDQGVQFFKKPNGDELVIVNVGSGSRGALTEDEMTREPKVIVMRFDAEDLGLGQVTLDVRPADEVFDIEGRVRAEGRQMMVEAFVESLKDALQGQEGADLAEEVRQMVADLKRVRDEGSGAPEVSSVRLDWLASRAASQSTRDVFHGARDYLEAAAKELAGRFHTDAEMQRGAGVAGRAQRAAEHEEEQHPEAADEHDPEVGQRLDLDLGRSVDQGEQGGRQHPAQRGQDTEGQDQRGNALLQDLNLNGFIHGIPDLYDGVAEMMREFAEA